MWKQIFKFYFQAFIVVLYKLNMASDFEFNPIQCWTVIYPCNNSNKSATQSTTESTVKWASHSLSYAMAMNEWALYLSHIHELDGDEDQSIFELRK